MWLQSALLRSLRFHFITYKMSNNSRHPRAILNEDNPLRCLVQCLAQMCSQHTFAWHITTACCHHYSNWSSPTARPQFLPQKTQRLQLIISAVSALLKCKLAYDVRIHGEEHECAPFTVGRAWSCKLYLRIRLLSHPFKTSCNHHIY